MEIIEYDIYDDVNPITIYCLREQLIRKYGHMKVKLLMMESKELHLMYVEITRVCVVITEILVTGTMTGFQYKINNSNSGMVTGKKHRKIEK